MIEAHCGPWVCVWIKTSMSALIAQRVVGTLVSQLPCALNDFDLSSNCIILALHVPDGLLKYCSIKANAR